MQHTINNNACIITGAWKHQMKHQNTIDEAKIQLFPLKSYTCFKQANIVDTKLFNSI